MEHMAILKQMSLFDGLDPLELVQVSKLVKNRRYEAGDMVILEGDEGSSLFVVKAGDFRAYADRTRAEKELARFSPNGSFGELALIDNAPRSASVVAETKGELLEFTAQDLKTLMGYSQTLQIKLMNNIVRDLAGKLRNTNDRLLQLL